MPLDVTQRSPGGLKTKLQHYALLMRLHRPIGIWLLMWPTLWALWLAGDGQPSLHVTFVFIAGVVLMRSAGCVINDYADRDFDPHVARTKTRPLAAGDVRPKEALILFSVLALTAFALVLTLNWQTILMSFIGVFLAILYPFTKRFTHLPQMFLGAAFAWGVPMAFMAETESVPLAAWVLFAVTLLWAMAYDTMYAMVDRDDDLKIGVKSTAILFGDSDRLIIAILQFLVLLLLVWVGVETMMSWPYYLSLFVAAALSAYQQYLIKEREKAACFKAFLNNNWFGAAIFGGILGHSLINF